MGGSPWVIEHGAAFTRIMLAGNVTVVMLFMINAIFRGAGDAAIAMRTLWLANWINILLGPCLIFGLGPFPKLGIVGAAIATNIGRGTGALFALSKLLRKGGRFNIERRHLRIEPAIIARLLRLSATGTFQVFIGMASWIGLVRIISSFGSNAVAGFTFGIRVILFALLPSWGMANAAATMVGQALGARDPERAERAVWKAGFYNMIFLGIVGLLFIFFAPQIIWFYTDVPECFSIRRRLSSHRRVRFSLLRLRHGAHAIVQWRRRHVDANDHQPLCLLVVGDSARLRTQLGAGNGAARSVRGNDHRVFDPRRRQRGCVPARALEEESCLDCSAF